MSVARAARTGWLRAGEASPIRTIKEISAQGGRILEVMTTSRGSRPKHLPSSPFKPAVEPVVEVFEIDDRVTHDLHGLGRVTAIDAHAVTVDFGSKVLRVPHPYPKLHHL